MADPGTCVSFRNADLGRFRKVRRIPEKFNLTFSFINIHPFLTRMVPLESSHPQLSNASKIIKNGSILRNLWANRNNRVSHRFFRFRNCVPPWAARNSYAALNPVTGGTEVFFKGNNTCTPRASKFPASMCGKD